MFGQLELAPQRHHLIVGGGDHRDGDVDLVDPRSRAEAAERQGGLADQAGVVPAQLACRPPPQVGGDEAAGEDPSYRAPAGYAESLGQAMEADVEASDAEEEHAVVDPSAEVPAGGTEHHSRHSLGMAVPDQLGDRAAHGIADRDEPVDAEHVCEGGHVVGAVSEAEVVAAHTSPVSSVIDGDDPVPMAEGSKGGRPVGPARGAQPVQQQHYRSARWSRRLADEGTAATG